MDDRSGQVIGVAVTFLILTWVTVGLRCYVRYGYSKLTCSTYFLTVLIEHSW